MIAGLWSLRFLVTPIFVLSLRLLMDYACSTFKLFSPFTWIRLWLKGTRWHEWCVKKSIFCLKGAIRQIKKNVEYGSIGIATLWTGSGWLMQNTRVHSHIFSNTKLHLLCSKDLELLRCFGVWSFQRFWNHGVTWPSLTSLSNQASVQYLWQPQSRPISSQQTCQIPTWNC